MDCEYWLRAGRTIDASHKINQNDYLAEIFLRTSGPSGLRRSIYARLSLMVWILKREVRAFGGCLGMYRRRRTWHAAISVGEL